MATTKDIKVSVEKAALDALRNLAQEVWTQHGICIKNVSFEWRDASRLNEDRMQVTDIEATMLTKS